MKILARLEARFRGARSYWSPDAPVYMDWWQTYGAFRAHVEMIFRRASIKKKVSELLGFMGRGEVGLQRVHKIESPDIHEVYNLTGGLFE